MLDSVLLEIVAEVLVTILNVPVDEIELSEGVELFPLCDEDNTVVLEIVLGELLCGVLLCRPLEETDGNPDVDLLAVLLVVRVVEDETLDRLRLRVSELAVFVEDGWDLLLSLLLIGLLECELRENVLDDFSPLEIDVTETDEVVVDADVVPDIFTELERVEAELLSVDDETLDELKTFELLETDVELPEVMLADDVADDVADDITEDVADDGIDSDADDSPLVETALLCELDFAEERLVEMVVDGKELLAVDNKEDCRLEVFLDVADDKVVDRAGDETEVLPVEETALLCELE